MLIITIFAIVKHLSIKYYYEKNKFTFNDAHFMCYGLYIM